MMSAKINNLVTADSKPRAARTLKEKKIINKIDYYSDDVRKLSAKIQQW